MLRGERGEGVVVGLLAGLRIERHLLERLGPGARRRAGRVVCGQMQMVEDLADHGRVGDQGQNLHGLGAAGACEGIEVERALEKLGPGAAPALWARRQGLGRRRNVSVGVVQGIES